MCQYWELDLYRCGLVRASTVRFNELMCIFAESHLHTVHLIYFSTKLTRINAADGPIPIFIEKTLSVTFRDWLEAIGLSALSFLSLF